MRQPTSPAPSLATPPRAPHAARQGHEDWLHATLAQLLTPAQYAELKKTRGEGLWTAAVRREWITDDAMLAALSTRFRMKIADLSQASTQALQAVTETLARRYRVLPLAISDSAVDIATADPHDLDCEHTLAFALGRTVRMSLAAPHQIAARLDELYRPEQVVEKIIDQAFPGVDDLVAITEDAGAELEFSLGKATDRPIIRLVDRIVAKAIQHRSSDIHLEPEEHGVMVRYRIDGVLKEDSVIPRALAAPLVARVKIMAQLDIADRLRPQDGRARVAMNGARIDLRVSTLPASLGEKVVIRILDSRSTVLALEGLGLAREEIAQIEPLLQAREGLVFVTGPTGSGKTTTLYSIIRQIQQRGVNIVTVEDPVEYRLQGIVQVQVNEKTGLTFPAALRSILRQDPDVILVGEIRDRETAQIAVQAALTGHLVLSTLHTIDAASSVTRLSDLGIEAYKTAAAFKGVVAQRLLRRLCVECRQPQLDPLPPALAIEPARGTRLFRGEGCGACSHTGYHGRLAITEVLAASAEVERRIAANESPDRIHQAGRDAGMRSLWESAVEHVKNGVTSVEELLRVLEAPASVTPGTARVARSAPLKLRPRAAAPSGRPGSLVFEGNAFDLLDEYNTRAAEPCAVLVVTDAPSLRDMIRLALQEDGFAVHMAADGAEALDQIDRQAPSVAVVDLDLPRFDGYSLLRKIRLREATNKLPVLAITAQAEEHTEARVLLAGANDYLPKPFRPEALLAKMNDLMHK
jgi:type II secretory ATPase GspE/PulE/Tfp pilus assembly ATPase PilB-like protein/CheY-like chemotaxis protein